MLFSEASPTVTPFPPPSLLPDEEPSLLPDEEPLLLPDEEPLLPLLPLSLLPLALPLSLSLPKTTPWGASSVSTVVVLLKHSPTPTKAAAAKHPNAIPSFFICVLLWISQEWRSRLGSVGRISSFP